MARPKAFDHDDVLDKATQVFWLKGYEATSVQDLVDATGVNRGSLYNTFTDKAGLFGAVLGRYTDRSPARKLVANADDGPPRATIEAFFGDLVEIGAADPERRGCLLTNTAVELAPVDAEVADYVRGALAGIEDAFARLVERGQSIGEIGPWKDARSVARHLLAAAQGLRVMAKIGYDRAALCDIADHALAVLD